jgi:hypothetical protein
MHLIVEIREDADRTIKAGAGVDVAAALRRLADTAEVGGTVSGPLYAGDGAVFGHFRMMINREGGEYTAGALTAEDRALIESLAIGHRPLGLTNERAEELTGLAIDRTTTLSEVAEAAEDVLRGVRRTTT